MQELIVDSNNEMIVLAHGLQVRLHNALLPTLESCKDCPIADVLELLRAGVVDEFAVIVKGQS